MDSSFNVFDRVLPFKQTQTVYTNFFFYLFHCYNSLLRSSATLIAILSKCNVNGVGKKLIELEVIQMLIAQLSEENTSPELVALRLTALDAMSKHVEGAAQVIVDNGGIAAITLAMWNNGSSADCTAAGMSLLSNCSATNGFSEAMQACGGIDIVLALLTTHAFDERVSTAAAQVLATTCSVADVEASLVLLRSTIDNKDSTGTADGLNRLANLMSIDAIHEEIEVVQRVAAIVQEAMNAFPDSDAVNNAGLRVLAEIASRNMNMSKLFLEDGEY
tara:strand:+ start:1473 stop:2297 length:825 start_codon:yes stop_codon:yes gene_type:complete